LKTDAQALLLTVPICMPPSATASPGLTSASMPWMICYAQGSDQRVFTDPVSAMIHKPGRQRTLAFFQYF
jgi:hypothetical protein